MLERVRHFIQGKLEEREQQRRLLELEVLQHGKELDILNPHNGWTVNDVVQDLNKARNEDERKFVCKVEIGPLVCDLASQNLLYRSTGQHNFQLTPDAHERIARLEK